jgi:hypothetical protein
MPHATVCRMLSLRFLWMAVALASPLHILHYVIGQVSIPDCTSSAIAQQLLSDVNISAQNNRDLLAIGLLKTGLRARVLHHRTEATVDVSTNSLTYREIHDKGRIVLTLTQANNSTSAVLECCSNAERVSQEQATRVLKALSKEVLQAAFDQPSQITDQWLTFYNAASKPRTAHEFALSFMKYTHSAVEGATKEEVREALGGIPLGLAITSGVVTAIGGQ